MKKIIYSLKEVCEYHIIKGMKAFLILSRFALTAAWLPDIVTSLVNGTSLDFIEVYTTEITYVLDMGILSPLMFLTLYLLNRENPFAKNLLIPVFTYNLPVCLRH